MASIFLLEDDFYLQRDLREFLMHENYTVTAASTLSEAKRFLLNGGSCDLYLVDVWLPDGEGFDFVTMLRENSVAPVLFLTALSDEASVIRGLNAGADDYVTKPFRAGELLSRIAANLRRTAYGRNVKSLKSEHITLNLSDQQVTEEGQTVELRPMEVRLLTLLMKNSGKIVKRDALLSVSDASLFADDVEDNALSVQISRLRKKFHTDCIETVRGFGYRFREEVKESYEE